MQTQQVALVTGAGGGIGREIGLGLARRGLTLVLTDIREEGARETARQAAALGAETQVLAADLTDPAQVAALVGEVTARFGRIDVLVNNAGILKKAPLLDMEEADWDRQIDIMLTAPFRVAKAVAPVMIRQGAGRIINVASNVAFVPRWGNLAYGAAKAGVIMLTRSLALDLARHGIRANAVCPGGTATDMIVTQSAGNLDMVVKGVAEEYRTGIPTGRLAKPEEQAAMIAFLACDAPDHVTGHAFVCDGGQSLVS